MYRTSLAATEEIVLERRSRPRLRLVHAAVFTAAASSVTVMAMLGAHDRWLVAQVATAALAVVALVAMLVRTRRFTIARAGRELRIRDGRRKNVVLLAEVREVEIDTRGEHTHALVLVLDGNRRLPLGAPFSRMSDAVAERRALRNALTRP